MRPDPLRIAMVSIHSSPAGELGARDTGGMSVYIRELAQELGTLGHSVDIFTREPSRPVEPVVRLSAAVRLVHLRGEMKSDRGRTALYPYLPTFFQAMEHFRASEGGRYDVVHSHYWLSGRMGTWAKELWGVPHVTMFHTLAAVKNRTRCGEAEPPLRIAQETELARRCDLIVAPTQRERDHVIRYCGAAPGKVALIPCGVNLESFQPVDRGTARGRLGLGERETVVLYVGRFAPVKGLNRLVEAFALLADLGQTRLVIVGGDGLRTPSAERLRERVGGLGISESVTFAGSVDQRELPFYYSAADLLAVPSYYESFGLVALEALACGTPVVATRVGAMEGILAEPHCGAIASDATPEGLARELGSFLNRTRSKPAPRERIRSAVRRYTWSKVASEISDEYADLVGSSLESREEGLFRRAAAQ